VEYLSEAKIAPESIEIEKTIETPIVDIRDTVKQKIKEAFPDNYELMTEIAYHESRLYPDVINEEWHRDQYGNNICKGSVGIFQVGCVNYAGDRKDLKDIDLNIKLAKQILQRQGFRAWGVCTNGTVDCGL